ncbi:MAG TPA: FAD-dependent oxidoreductase [Acidimicrobiales bacterium]|nr:FAD-dependent oxidoreductase [Acidimicrobiales bacterium]
MDRPIHVVGGGIAGLVAAITAAEAGAPVVVHEASDRPGGRALGGTDRTGVNLGPHVVFTDGALVRWLRTSGITVRLRGPVVRGVRVLDDGGSHLPMVESLQLAATLPPRRAPVDESFRAWADDVFGSKSAALLCRLAGLFTFHDDPGTLSARFVWDRYRRTVLSSDRVRWVAGGWSTLVDALVDRARARGVRIETDHRLGPEELPEGPTIVATRLGAAARLLERELTWQGSRAALLDVVTARGTNWPSIVADVRSDLATCCMIERETAVEPGLLDDEGVELFQAHLGVGPGVSVGRGVARIEEALDRAVVGWRERLVWRRAHLLVDSTGAVDPPGTTWRDRPSIDQGEDRFLAGDAVAAPGLLSEVTVNSAVQAARLALEARRRRVFAPGWPSVDLSPERRLAVLAAVLPASSLHRAERPADGGQEWEVEPVDETGPGYRLAVRAGVLRGTAVAEGPYGRRVTTLTWMRRPRPVARLLNRLCATLPRAVVAAWRPSRVPRHR